ncbi:cation:proton antiporter, partial [Oceanithermus sp.]|uniref:cation:proton antiporter domain-containing protein n=1 Tax=Oceanithermus sp. TaxID=2268145 RepID=UPI0026002406
LAGVWVVFAIAEALLPEAGLMAAVAMGLVFQRSEVPEERRLRHFKEQLTVLGISVLFILLAANLPLEVVLAAGWPAVWTALLLALVVRPVAVALATPRSSLGWREKFFIAWIGPRGIVAASVASLFALGLARAGIDGGERLLAFVFVTIFITVTLAGLTAPLVARALGLSSQAGKLALIVGAGPLARKVGLLLKDHGRQVVLVDRNQSLVWAARRAGLEAELGNALEEDTLASLGADEAEVLLAATTNPEVNVLAVAIAREEFHTARAHPVVDVAEKGVSPEMVEQIGGQIAFGRPIDIRDWEHALNYEPVVTLVWEVPEGLSGRSVADLALPDFALPLVRLRGDEAAIVHAGQTWSRGDRVVVVSRKGEEATRAALDALAQG